MKRLITILLLVLMVSYAFAMQETFTVSSPEYQQTMSLCRVAGIEPQAMVSPISADQLLTLLSKVDFNTLSSAEQDVFNKLVDHLENPYMVYGDGDNGFDAIITVSPDVFFHTSEEDILAMESVEPKRDVLPLFEVGGKVYLSEYFFGAFYFQEVERETERQKHITLNFGEDAFIDTDYTSPFKALVSAGKNGFNFSIGRDQLSLGSGKTGNLLLGDNFWYEDFAKLSYVRGMFSYDMTLISFDLNDEYKYNPLHFGHFDFNSAHEMVVIHQFSFRPFKWFNLSAAEGMLQYGNNLFGDLSILNPFMLLHNVNSYYEGTANNFFSLDFAFTPAKSWHFNTTLYFDQIQQTQELNDGEPWDDTPPNAFGVLLNTTYSKALFNGIADFYIEGVYTNPAVYLKEQKNVYNRSMDNYWDLDLIVGNALSADKIGDVGYLGYKYGPDTIAIGTGFDYSEIDKLQVSFDALFKIHGAKGMKLYNMQQDYNDVGPDYFRLKTPTYTEGVNAPEYRFSLIASGKYQPTDWVTVQAEAGYIRAWNYHNEIGKDFSDIQFAIGFKLNPVHLGAGLVRKLISK